MTIAQSDSKVRSFARALRLAILSLVLLLSTTLGLLHQFGKVKPVGVDALCPFGGIESAWAVIASGTLLSRVAWSSFILLGATLLSAILFRRSFCGNVCPLGTLQGGFAWLGKKLLGARFTVPAALDRWGRYLKYLVLVVFVVFSAALGTLVIRPYDPWVAYHHLLSPELIDSFLIGLVILVLSVVGSFFYDRVFCKYLCPMGAALAPFAKLGIFEIRRNASTCIDCGACDRTCPVNLPVSRLDRVTDLECLDCDQCVNACPVRETLIIQGPGSRRLGSALRIAATAAIFLLVVGITSFTGSFQWTMPPLTTHADATGRVVLDPATIKGTDTWQSVIAASGISREAFTERFELTEADLDQAIRIKAHSPGSKFDVEVVRQFVRERSPR